MPSTAALSSRCLTSPSDGDWRALRVAPSGAIEDVPPADLREPGTFRQVYIVSAGYTPQEEDKFLADASDIIRGMGTAGKAVYTDRYRERLVYLVHFLPGGDLNGADPATFRARTFDHPMRHERSNPALPQIGLTLEDELVADAVDDFRRTRLDTFQPLAAFVIFDLDRPEGRTTIPNAILPTLMIPQLLAHDVRDYGIVRMGRLHGSDRDALTAAHELAHAALNFADEYCEAALGATDPTAFDLLTPLYLFDGSRWGAYAALQGVLLRNFDIRSSECVVENGWDNVSLRARPALVGTSDETYPTAGGMFFCSGAWHESNASLMRSHAPAHPSSHERVLRRVFEDDHPIPRANDRIRPAGPMLEWLPNFGPRATLLLFDGDKHHRWHPTTQYTIELRWCELVRERASFRHVTRTVTYAFAPTLRTIDLRRSLALRAAGAAQRVLHRLGIDRIRLGASAPEIRVSTPFEELLDTLLPAPVWPIPYQDVEITLPQRMTRYEWRFKTDNGAHTSAWTEWRPITRGL